MDLDTKQKRSSSFLFSLPFGRVEMDPDGAIAGVDKQQIAFAYSGIDTASGGGPTTQVFLTPMRGIQQPL